MFQARFRAGRSVCGRLLIRYRPMGPSYEHHEAGLAVSIQELKRELETGGGWGPSVASKTEEGFTPDRLILGHVPVPVSITFVWNLPTSSCGF